MHAKRALSQNGTRRLGRAIDPVGVAPVGAAPLSDIVTAGLPTVAVRASANYVFNRVARTLDRPLAAPSANRFGSISPTSAAAVLSGNRNFEGRQGRGGRTHLLSPVMAAAAAITGHLTDVRKWEFGVDSATAFDPQQVLAPGGSI